MSQFYEYNWPTPIEDGILLDQTTTANTPLLLNGSYVNKTTGIVNFINFGIVPRITITSAENFSAVDFLITGYQNGVFISETLAGPDSVTNTSVTSVNCFDTVERIIPSNTLNENVQVGVASVGYFPIILLNTAKTNTSGINYSVHILAATANPATYQVFLSLRNNLGMGKYDDLITNGNFFSTQDATTESQFINDNNLIQNLLIKIDTNDDNSILTAQFLQL